MFLPEINQAAAGRTEDGMTIFNVINLAGGIALFLYGMSIMGTGLEKLAGGKMEAVLQRLTSSVWKAVLLGAILTGLIVLVLIVEWISTRIRVKLARG